MGRVSATILGLAIVAGGAIYVSSTILKPATEEAQRREPVLTGALDAKLEECRLLEDVELPGDLKPPEVGEDRLYLLLVVLYPQRADAPEEEHRLNRVNGHPDLSLRPEHVEAVIEPEGALVHLTFQIDSSFQFAQLVRGEELLFDKISLE